MTSSTITRGAATRALLSLAIGSFGIGMTEFVVMGLLPQIAADVLPGLSATDAEAAIAQAGWLISLYALGVVVGAPTIAASVAKYPRHRVMLALAAALTLFNALTFLMPNFELIAVSRFLAGLPHGAYFGIGALVASDVLGPGSRARGAAFILSGLTVANIVGVPLGTFLGQQLGWRIAFAIVAGIFALTTVLVALFVPAHAGDPARTLRAELSAFRIPQVWFAIGIGAVGFGGFFAAYSYIAPIVTHVAGAPEWAVPIVLVVMGVGMTVGNLIGGHLADIDLKRTLLGGFVVFIVIQLLLALTAGWIITLAVFIFAVGAVTSALGPTIQSRLMSVAGDNQSIAAALNHSALNIGNALGAFLGGLVIAHGFGFVAPIWVGLVLAVAGFILALVSYAIEDQRRVVIVS
ncbi:MAG: arabinose ABC transporter permease [Microbacterium sp. SCN 70-200]|uniref:MFS transporter n=1 Tax=unclassified Microbacterium TaxID=2609290 RepID=UPI00086C280E|nr:MULTISPECIES: MFS transporter [unclassified Microbacterium]MBN9213917.1 MFS transporter [Microbacterium sp.]ODT42457.1 MAG: arabinose ABC transporter permease [Microbacterium sp. SCN 70-200]OJV85414.1 MAG: arabinose ABC transporter permease [Microbacterium sp. 70-16]